MQIISGSSVLHDCHCSKSSPKQKVNVNETFDLYVDRVDNLPDNATIVKVTPIEIIVHI